MTPTGPPGVRATVFASAFVGVLMAVLVAAGNPGNMGICGACFLRDVGGALGLHRADPVRYLRPEIAGLLLGSFAAVAMRGRFHGRSGSLAVYRFVFGLWMAIGTLVFLGCPFRLFQRLGGGDLFAIPGALGLVAGVGMGVFFENRGYSVGRTSEVSPVVGSLGPLLGATFVLLLLFRPSFLAFSSSGPGARHAPLLLSLALAGIAGAVLQRTRFCGISAARGLFGKDRRLLWGALALVAAYLLASVATGRFRLSGEGAPIAHGDLAWSFLGMVLAGLTGALAGGCPVRQVVMAGEGNGDALVTVFGLIVGGALAHDLGFAASASGVPAAGRVAVVVGLAFTLAYGSLSLRKPAAATAAP